MIKKNTKIVFEKDTKEILDLKGGIPLSKGEIIKINKEDKIIEYEVIDKKVEISFEGEDQIVNITYVLR